MLMQLGSVVMAEANGYVDEWHREHGDHDDEHEGDVKQSYEFHD
jgi:hypothetical protein